MKKAARRKTPTTLAQYDVERSAAMFSAKQQFVGAAINMGWQLAITVLVPVIIGVKLDQRFHTSPSYTLAALVLAVAGACMVVWSTLKQVGKEQASKENNK